MAKKYPGVDPLDQPGQFRLRIRVRNKRTGRKINTMRHFQGTLRQAVAERKRLMNKFAEGEEEVRDDERTTLGVYSKRWIEVRKAKGEKYSTRRVKVQALKDHMLPDFGDWYVVAIRRSDVEDWLARTAGKPSMRTGEPVSPVTVNLWLRTFQACVSAFYREHELGVSPLAGIEPLRVPPRPKNDPNSLPASLLPDVLEKFKDLYPQHYAMLFVGMTTGMRWSELSALEWDDIDEEAGRIWVGRGQVCKRVDTTKTNEERWLPLVPEMAEVLRWHRRRLVEQQAPGLDRGLMFPSKVGDYSFSSRFVRPLRRVREELGIPFRLTTKVMRRTFNNLLRQEQVDRLVLRSLTGHSSEEMTGLYSTIEDRERQAAVANVVRLAQRGSGDDGRA